MMVSTNTYFVQVQYEGPEKPQVFREAAIIADRLVCADVENAQQQPSDDEFSDTEPEPEPEVIRKNNLTNLF